MKATDPDVLVGYEIQSSSWGYIFQRSIFHQLNFGQQLSRLNANKSKSTFSKEDNPYGHKKNSSLSCTGRLFFNVWRLMRSELTLTSYSLESVAFKVLNQRLPRFSITTLSLWYQSGLLSRWKTYKYYFTRAKISLIILHELDIIGKTRYFFFLRFIPSEFARVYGIEFSDVLTRGSQFRVESMMCRLALPENYVMVSPSKEQVELEIFIIGCRNESGRRPSFGDGTPKSLLYFTCASFGFPITLS